MSSYMFILNLWYWVRLISAWTLQTLYLHLIKPKVRRNHNPNFYMLLAWIRHLTGAYVPSGILWQKTYTCQNNYYHWRLGSAVILYEKSWKRRGLYNIRRLCQLFTLKTGGGGSILIELLDFIKHFNTMP